MAQGAERLIKLMRQPGTTTTSLFAGALGEGWFAPCRLLLLRRWFLSVNAKHGLCRVRIGDAPNPGPATRRRLTQRCGHCDGLDSDTESDEEGCQVGSTVNRH